MSIRSHLGANGLVGAMVPLLVGSAALGLIWADLPASVATHWGADGTPDVFTDRSAGLIALTLGLPMLTWAVLLAVTAAVPRSAPGSRVLQALPSGMSWWLISLLLVATIAQTGPDGAAVGLSGWWMLGSMIAAAIGTGMTARLIAPPPPLPARSGPPNPAATRLASDDGGDLWWSGTAPTSTVMIVVAVVLVLAGLVLAWTAAAWMLALLLPVAALLAASSQARVTIGRERVVVAGGLAGWPRLSVDLDTIAVARATTTGMWEWGGWGLRVRPGGTAVITRAGEALELRRTDDTRVVITVEDADTAAAVVNTLLERV